MVSRRRIDWSVILSPDAATPAWGEGTAASDQAFLLLALGELAVLDDADAMLRRAVELSLSPVGLVRAGIYLYDEPLDLMLGTWGTNLQGALVDEHHAMFELGKQGQRVFERAVSGEACWTVVEHCPIIDQSNQDTRVVGEGWVVCTPIRSSRRCLGMLYNDAGLTDASVEPRQQARVAVLCSLVGGLLETTRQSGRISVVSQVSPRHPLLRRAVRMLAGDPSLGGNEISAQLEVSLSRLARLFKSELGMSLVDYRNQLRLERFMILVDSGRTNLLEAALAAGFGSYAQFHRVFRALRGKTPREYLLARGQHRPDRK
ncbi:helix-turn-helix domain-containing protein [Myxococcota bacterium]